MKYRNIKHLTVLTLITMLTFSLTSCRKNSLSTKSTLSSLYEKYQNGFIDECQYNGQTVYCAGLNAYDAGSNVYDKDGKQIGTCNRAWGPVDQICDELTKCETIYRVQNNIWQQPAVDKYDLGK